MEKAKNRRRSFAIIIKDLLGIAIQKQIVFFWRENFKGLAKKDGPTAHPTFAPNLKFQILHGKFLSKNTGGLSSNNASNNTTFPLLSLNELANLDKDSDSRKSAMKAPYVKGLDSKAIPQFLAQVSETRLGLCPVNIQFHCMKFLLVSMEVIGTVSRWMPLAVYWGKLACTSGQPLHSNPIRLIQRSKRAKICARFPLHFVIFGSSINEGKNPYSSPVRRNGIIDELAVNIRAHGIGCAVVNIRTQDLVEGRAKMNKSCDLLDEVSFGANVPCFSSILLISAENNLSPQVANQLGGIKSEDALFLKLGWIRWLLNRTSSLTYAVIAPGFHALYLEATVKMKALLIEKWGLCDSGKLRAQIKTLAEAISLDYLVADSFVALAIPRDVELYECPCLLINGCKMSLCRFSSAAWSQKRQHVHSTAWSWGSYVIYNVKLLQKSGASKQSSSFLKATTMTLFTISESEKASYVHQIYSYLGDDPFLKQFLPIDPATKDLFDLVKDGLINIAVPGIVDERAVSTKRDLNPWPHLFVGLISLIIKIQLLVDLSFRKTPQQVELDGKAYAYLLNILAPEYCNPSMFDTKDPKERAKVILDHAERESAILNRYGIIAHKKENVVKKQGLTCDEMEAEREELAFKSSQVASVLETSSWTAGNKDIQG
uniref:Uncharacterized protein n=1 Tax=Salix viminalis TaxID=40686 RepID=A0A6N2M2U7_SALVM